MKSLSKALALYFSLHCFFITALSAQSTERIHVHFDKDIYLPGEMVWFKVYIFDGGRPTTSTNLYAGWYDNSGKLLKEKRFPVFGGATNGDFAVPDSAPNPVYQLRLFTKKMRQSDSTSIVIKPVAVYQRSGGASAAAPAAGNNSLEIFPEGGSLVAGIVNHIAFKITGETTMQIAPAALTDANGTLADSIYFEGNTARLQFTPKPATRYLVKWTGTDGQLQTTILPAAEMNGATLHTEMAGKDLYYIVQKNNTIPRFDKLRINVNSGKDVLYSALLNLEKMPQLVNKLPADSLPAGMLDISLTDVDGNTLQKKTVFIKNKTAPPVVTVIEKSSLPKGKNVIEIKVNDTSVNLLSLSIVDELFYPDNKTSIVDELLLNRQSAELFNASGDAKRSDLIIQTAGLKYTAPGYNTAAPDNYLSLLAYLDKSKALPPKSTLTLIATDKVSGRQVFALVPGEEKNFLTSGLVVYDSAKLYYQMNTKELSNFISLAEISSMKQPFSISAAQPVSRAGMKIYSGNESPADTYVKVHAEKFNELTTLKTIQVKSKKKNSYMARLQELDDRYASGMFKGFARGEAFNVLEDPMADGYYDVYSYIAGKVPGVSVRRSSMGGSITSNRGITGQDNSLAIFIDEMAASADMLAGLPLSQVAYIKVINGIVIGAGGSSVNGAIYVYTRRGNDVKVTTPPMHSISIKGYDLPKDFSNPDYSEKQSLLNKDYRSTLYWNPYIETDKETQVIRIEFYNNDVSKKPVLTLKGFNEEGELIEVRKVLE